MRQILEGEFQTHPLYVHFLRPLRSLRLISEVDYSYFVIFVPFVVISESDFSALARACSTCSKAASR